jgi:hypothetical protein
VRWQRNPFQPGQRRWRLTGRALWLWRASNLALIALVILLAESYLGALVVFVLWLIAEALQRS